MKRLSIFAALFALALPTLALEPGDHIENFKLMDQMEKSHELYSFANKKIVVLLTHGNGCPIARNANHTYKALREKYAAKGVEFLMLNANIQDNLKSIAKESSEFDIDFPILIDETQAIAKALGVERTADAYVIDTSDWTIKYRGALDDRLGYETQKQQAAHDYVADALDALLAGKAVAVDAVEAKGCIVNIL
ncbi:hypothetical protein NBRC116493_01660 [Aurantivibrio infirmus]